MEWKIKKNFYLFVCLFGIIYSVYVYSINPHSLFEAAYSGVLIGLSVGTTYLIGYRDGRGY